VPPTFEDFNRLFLFTHLEALYHNRAFVLVDGDRDGRSVVERLKQRFTTWDPECFSTLNADDFEYYYPILFRDRADGVLHIGDQQEQRREKERLLKEVIEWIESDRDRAMQAFGESAAEVINKLMQIDAALFGPAPS
jgi:hypothetical protein